MTVRSELTQIGALPDNAINLTQTAMLLAVWALPNLDIEPYRRHIQALVNEARIYLLDDEPGAQLCAEAARQIIHRRYGYAGILQPGDPGEQGDGANLARVIDKRRGSAMALCILYQHVLTALDVTSEILNFSARPVLRLQDATGQRLVLDPLDGGRRIDARDLLGLHRSHRGGDGSLDPFNLKPLSHREILVALQDQIKVHHLRHAAPEAALSALEAALLIAPQMARLWREAGLLHARLEHVGDAILALQHFLNLPGGDAHRYTVSQLLQQLQSRKDKNPS
jgi:regulator of sirC expression with transglutaminase-like and TPR domain